MKEETELLCKLEINFLAKGVVAVVMWGVMYLSDL